MRDWEARKLSKYHSFTKKELYLILKEALDSKPDNYWKKPNRVNRIFDNGSYFNSCVKWVDYKEGKNDDVKCHNIVSYRVLQCFGEYSKIQLPKKPKINIEIQKSEIPKL